MLFTVMLAVHARNEDTGAGAIADSAVGVCMRTTLHLHTLTSRQLSASTAEASQT